MNYETPPFADALFILLDRSCMEMGDQLQKFLKDGDEDSVHDLRVASRRLLEWSALFSELVPPLLIKPLQEKLEAGIENLSRLRNQDIFLGFLKSQAVRGKILKRASRRRKRLLKEARILLEEADVTGTEENLQEILGWIGQHWNEISSRRLGPSLSKILEIRSRAVKMALKKLVDPKLQNLHPLRKAMRRLRYAGEISREISGDPAEKLLGTLKHWQETLGAIRDSAVISKRLSKLKLKLMDNLQPDSKVDLEFRALDKIAAFRAKKSCSLLMPALKSARKEFSLQP